jgi:hypothetical protein
VLRIFGLNEQSKSAKALHDDDAGLFEAAREELDHRTSNRTALREQPKVRR